MMWGRSWWGCVTAKEKDLVMSKVSNNNEPFLYIVLFVIMMAFMSANAKAEQIVPKKYEVEKAELPVVFTTTKDKWNFTEKNGNPYAVRGARRGQLWINDDSLPAKLAIEGGLGDKKEKQILLRIKKDF